MAKSKYVIAKMTPTLMLLGVDKWLTRHDLLLNKHALCIFPDSATAGKMQSKLPAEIRNNTVINNTANICKAFAISFSDQKGFFQESFSGPMLETALMEPVRSELSAFAFCPSIDSENPSRKTKDGVVPIDSAETVSAAAMTSLINAKIAESDKPCLAQHVESTHEGVVMLAFFLERLSEILQYRQEVEENVEDDLAAVEREICDELHYAEFNALNAREGFAVYKRIHDLRLQRRKIKDTALIATYIAELLPDVTQQKTKDIMQKVENMQTRLYRLRSPDAFIHKKEGGDHSC